MSEISERLLHNLLYVDAIVIYSSVNQPLVQQLEQLQGQFNISYQTAQNDLTPLRNTIVRQLIGLPAAKPDAPLVEQLNGHIKADSRAWLLIIKGMPPSAFLLELLACRQVFKAKFKVILELSNKDAFNALNVLEKISAPCTLIGPTADSLAPQLDVKALKQTNNPISAHKLTIFIVLLSLLFAAAIFYFVTGSTQDKKTGLVKQAEIRQEPSDKKPAKEREQKELLDQPKKEVGGPDLTAAEYFNQKQKQRADKPLDTKKTELTEPVEPVLNKNQKPELTRPVEPELNNTQKTKPTETVEQALKKPVKSEFDNAWFLAQSPEHFVIQLSLHQQDYYRKNYIEQHKLQNKAKIYAGKNGVGITLGSYSSRQQAIDAKNKLPESLKAAGAFVKSVASIQNTIRENRKNN